MIHVTTKCFRKIIKQEPAQYIDAETHIEWRTFTCHAGRKTYAYRDRKEPLSGYMTQQEAEMFFDEMCADCKRFRLKVMDNAAIIP